MLPNRILVLRKKRGYSMQKLAAKVGTSQQQIDRLEKGKRKLTLDWMERLSDALDCTIVELLPDTQREKDFSNTAKAKVIGAIDAEDKGSLITFEEKEVYTIIFGRPKALSNPRLFALVVNGNGMGYKEGTELILTEIDRNQKIEDGTTVLCAERSGQYFLRKTPINSDREIPKAILVKVIQDA